MGRGQGSPGHKMASTLSSFCLPHCSSRATQGIFSLIRHRFRYLQLAVRSRDPGVGIPQPQKMDRASGTGCYGLNDDVLPKFMC